MTFSKSLGSLKLKCSQACFLTLRLSGAVRHVQLREHCGSFRGVLTRLAEAMDPGTQRTTVNYPSLTTPDIPDHCPGPPNCASSMKPINICSLRKWSFLMADSFFPLLIFGGKGDGVSQLYTDHTSHIKKLQYQSMFFPISL